MNMHLLLQTLEVLPVSMNLLACGMGLSMGTLIGLTLPERWCQIPHSH